MPKQALSRRYMDQDAPAVITKTWLNNEGACSGSVKFFTDIFPDGSAELTPENIRKYPDHHDLLWLKDRILTEEGERVWEDHHGLSTRRIPNCCQEALIAVLWPDEEAVDT